MKPVRLRFSRRKGERLRDLSFAINGLPVKLVTRPSKWGNVYVINGKHPDTGEPLTRVEAVQLFAEWVAPHANVIREHLAGFNLACTCHLCDRHAATGLPFGEKCADCDPCHADVLLDLANR